MVMLPDFVGASTCRVPPKAAGAARPNTASAPKATVVPSGSVFGSAALASATVAARLTTSEPGRNCLSADRTTSA